jgi:hypothetical protein
MISRLIWNYRLAATAANQVNLLADHRLESVFFDAVRATHFGHFYYFNSVKV